MIHTNLSPIADEEHIGHDASTWGTTTDTSNRDSQHTWDTWGGDSTTKQTRHNSPDLNAYRSGQCTYCDCNIGSKRMHGPLICYECRIFLKEDEEHDKEQQDYEDRRQAKYKKQLEGETEVTKTDKEEFTKEDPDPYDGHTYAVVRSPSPPRELPQNFTRITLAQVFILGLQDKNMFKTVRQDGTILTPRTHHIPLHLNRFACLPMMQDLPPIPRWATNTLLLHIAYLNSEEKQRGNCQHSATLLVPPYQQYTFKQLSQHLRSASSEQTLTPRSRHIPEIST